MIKEAQGNKELGIKVSSAMRASLDFAVAAVADSRFETQEEREEATDRPHPRYSYPRARLRNRDQLRQARSRWRKDQL